MAINMPTQQRSPLDAIANALNVVGKIYDIKANNEALEQAKATQAMRADEYKRNREGVLTQKDIFQHADKYSIANAGDKAAQQFKVTTTDGGTQDVYLKPKEPSGSMADAYLKALNIQKLQGELADRGKAKPLPPDKVLSVNEGNVIPNQLASIESTLSSNTDLFGPVAGRIGSLNPYNERTKTIDAQLKSTAQAFGRYMEGGVLRKEDEEKYRDMFPSRNDTPEVAANKLALVRKLLVDKQKSNVDALDASNYDVTGVRQLLGESKTPAILTGSKSKSPLIPEARADNKKQGMGKFGPSVQQNGHTYYWNPQSGKYE